MSCEAPEQIISIMENNHLNMDNIQLGEKKQKLHDPNILSVPITPEIILAEQLATPLTELNNTHPTIAASVSNPSMTDVPHLQPVAHPSDASLSFQIPYQTWATFVLQFKALEHKVEELTRQVAVMNQRPGLPAPNREITLQPAVQSANVEDSPSANVIQTSSTSSKALPRYAVAPPLPAEEGPQGTEEKPWQTKLSKRGQKSVSTVVPANAAAVQPFPFLRAVLADRCSEQSSCRCSRCMPPPPPRVTPSKVPSPITPAPPSNLHLQVHGGGTLSKNPPRTFREKIAAIKSRDDLLDRLVARVQEKPAGQDSQASRSVSSIYISCRLTKQAEKDRLFSFKKIFQGFTQVAPLECNLVSSSMAEIFLLEDQKEQALGLLPDTMIVWNPPLSFKDVKRRAASYNRSYFRELRQASLQGLSNQLQLEVLTAAEAAVPRLPIGRQKSVIAAIHQDRKWVLAQ